MPVDFNVAEMPIEGLAKIRYDGAWAIRKLFNHNLKYVKDNYDSQFSSTIAMVEEKTSHV